MLKIKSDHDGYRCHVCKEIANTKITNGHVERTYFLCKSHANNIVYPVRVIDVIEMRRVSTKQYSPVRFNYSFLEIAVRVKGQLILVSCGVPYRVKSRTITLDKRNAVDYLFDNLPINCKGNKYRVGKMKASLTGRQIPFYLSNSANYYPYSKTMRLDEVYIKLINYKCNLLTRKSSTNIMAIQTADQ